MTYIHTYDISMVLTKYTTFADYSNKITPSSHIHSIFDSNHNTTAPHLTTERLKPKRYPISYKHWWVGRLRRKTSPLIPAVWFFLQRGWVLHPVWRPRPTRLWLTPLGTDGTPLAPLPPEVLRRTGPLCRLRLRLHVLTGSGPLVWLFSSVLERFWARLWRLAAGPMFEGCG